MAPGAKAGKTPSEQAGHMALARAVLTPAVAEGDFLRPCLHRSITGAVHSQSWKLQQPISRHYNNLHSVVMERSIQKKCSAGA